jgi:putative transposase
MIEPEHPSLSVRRQCALVGLSPSSYYYHGQPVEPPDMDVMSRIGRLFTDHPYYGVERMVICLRREGGGDRCDEWSWFRCTRNHV